MPLSTDDLAKIQEIVTRSVASSLDGFEEKLKASFNDIVDEKLKPLREDFEKFKSEMNTKFDAQQVIIDEQKKTIKAQQEDINFNAKQISDYEHIQILEKIKLLELEIHHRKYNMIVTNLKEATGTESFSTLVAEFKQVLENVVHVPETLVQQMTFKAAHRLGKKQDGNTRPRSAIFVFEKQEDINACWANIRKLGKSPYNFKTHLPPELTQYRTDLLIARDSAKTERGAVIRVGEEKGFPYMDEKVNGRWIRKKHYKDQYASHLPVPPVRPAPVVRT